MPTTDYHPTLCECGPCDAERMEQACPDWYALTPAQEFAVARIRFQHEVHALAAQLTDYDLELV